MDRRLPASVGRLPGEICGLLAIQVANADCRCPSRPVALAIAIPHVAGSVPAEQR